MKYAENVNREKGLERSMEVRESVHGEDSDCEIEVNEDERESENEQSDSENERLKESMKWSGEENNKACSSYILFVYLKR